MMKLTLDILYGRAGVGKTRCILKRAAAAQQLGKNVIYLVPEQFSLQSEKSLLAQAGNGLFGAQVLSFRRMAYLVFAETGLPAKKSLDDAGKNMLLRKIVTRLKDELTYFKGAADKAGFIGHLSQLVSEFYRYGVTEQGLAGAASTGRLRSKLLDLSLILKTYTQYLQENYISSDETLDFLAQKILEATSVKGADIFIDGFKSFTPQEFKVLEQLFLCAGSVTIALTLNELPADGFLDGNDFFFETKKTARRLCDLAGKCDLEIIKTGFNCGKNHEKRQESEKSAALEFVAENYFRNNVKPFAGDCEDVGFVFAENMFEELRYTAEKITGLVRGGYEYNDIAVAACGLDEYAKNIKAVFSLYDIPVFIDETTDILSHPFVEYIRAALDIVAYDWRYESVFRLLKTDIHTIPRRETDLLENYVLAFGIKRGMWKKRWKYGFGGRYERFVDEEINALREEVVNMLAPLTERFTKTGKYSVRELSEGLYDFLDKQGAQVALERMINDAQSAGRLNDYLENSRIWGKVMGVLDKAVEILGDETMNVAAFAKILEAGFSGAKMELAPLAMDVCVVGDLRRTRLPNVKALFVVGANEGLLPAKLSDTGLFTDNDRQMLTDLGLEMSPFGVSKIFDEGISFYSAITKPVNYLSVSCYRSDADGKAASPSQMLLNLTDFLPTAKHAKICEKSGFIENLTPGFFDDKNVRQKIKRIETALISSGKPEVLSEKTARKLYPGIVRTSVSRLERFARCPFSYFAEYNLSLKERRVYEVQRVDLGNIFHDVLERFSEKLKLEDVNWNTAEPSKIAELTDRCVNETFDDAQNEIFKSSAQYQHFAKRIKDISQRSVWALTEHLKSGAFSLAFTEAAFADRAPDDKDGLYLGTIKLPLENGNFLLLEGRIDRIDLTSDEQGQLVKIIDYKSGGRAFNFNEFYYGLQLQLMLYMDAFLKKFKGAKPLNPCAVFYFKITNPFAEFGEGDAQANILKQFKMTGVVCDDERSLKALDALLAKSSGIFSYRSAAVSPEAFAQLLNTAVQKAETLGNAILRGEINAAPYKTKSTDSCAYCAYKPVCKHEG